MSGRCTGVQTRMREKAPLAYDVHCYGHRLNLMIVDTIKKVPQAADFLSLLEQLHFFFYKHLFWIIERNYISSLVTLQFILNLLIFKRKCIVVKKSASYRISASLVGGQGRLHVKTYSRFECVIQLIRNVSGTDKGARATTARGLLSQLNSEFLHLLYFREYPI